MNPDIAFPASAPLSSDIFSNTADMGMLEGTPKGSALGSSSGAADAAGASSSMVGQNMVLLSSDFQPGAYDVICGRGRKCFNHIGNARFRDIVATYLEQYANSAKVEKSYILSDIVNKVRGDSPDGGFVKKDPRTGRWYEVGDFLAREKTSQAFRDALHDQYKSSNTAKKKRRQAERAGKYYSRDSSRSLGDDSQSDHSSLGYATGGSFYGANMLEDPLMGGGVDVDDFEISFATGGDPQAIGSSSAPVTPDGLKQKGFATQHSARSVLEVGKMQQDGDRMDVDTSTSNVVMIGGTPTWLNRSCPNLKMSQPPASVLSSQPKEDASMGDGNLIGRRVGNARPQLANPQLEWMHRSQPNIFANRSLQQSKLSPGKINALARSPFPRARQLPHANSRRSLQEFRAQHRSSFYGLDQQAQPSMMEELNGDDAEDMMKAPILEVSTSTGSVGGGALLFDSLARFADDHSPDVGNPFEPVPIPEAL